MQAGGFGAARMGTGGGLLCSVPTQLRGSTKPAPAVWWPQTVVLTARGEVMLSPIYNQGSVSLGTRQLTRAPGSGPRDLQAHVLIHAVLPMDFAPGLVWD